MRYALFKEKAAERRAQIVAHYMAGNSLAETGKVFKITKQRVLQILKKERAKDGQDHSRGSDAAPAVGAGRNRRA